MTKQEWREKVKKLISPDPKSNDSELTEEQEFLVRTTYSLHLQEIEKIKTKLRKAINENLSDGQNEKSWEGMVDETLLAITDEK